MIHYAAPIDLAQEPSPVFIDGDTVTLSVGIAHYENTGLWGAQQMWSEWPGHPDADAIASELDRIWDEWIAEYIAQQAESMADPTDSALTNMYEQMLSMQEQQAATDAALCDLYEALAGGER